MSERKSINLSDVQDSPGSNSIERASSPSSNSDNSPTQIKAQDTFTGHSAPITRCKFSPDGTYVASSSTDGCVK